MFFANTTIFLGSDQAEFIRNQYYALEWNRPNPDNPWGQPTHLGTGILAQDTDMYCEILVNRPGSYHYYFVYENKYVYHFVIGYLLFCSLKFLLCSNVTLKWCTGFHAYVISVQNRI